MMLPNRNYARLKDSYLFARIARRVEDYQKAHPGARILRLGIGDVTQPLPKVVTEAMHEAVEDQASPERFQGYLPECGAPFLRRAIADHYRTRGIDVADDEVFVSSGASDELADILDLFDPGSGALVIEPAYPAYVDANVICGRNIVHLASGPDNGFLPEPTDDLEADLIYICSPNNPTGATYTRQGLTRWVDFANAHGSVILFDAAYESFVEDADIPRSVLEIEGARTCAIEICSLSKTAGFTGTRAGHTIVPRELVRGGMSLNDMWVRNRTTKTNGVSYILQRGAAAVFTPEGQEQVAGLVAHYKRNARVLMEALDAAGVWYTGGRNAPYLWMRCTGGLDSWAFFDRLLEEVQVVGTPGAGFGACGEGFFRLSTFGSHADTREAAVRLGQLLSRDR